MLIYNLKNRWLSNKSDLMSVLAPTVLILSTIFVFGPATIYSGNISEFDVGFIDILKYYVGPGIILLVIFVGSSMFLSKKYLSLLISLTLTVGFLLWIQGNFLVWEYGLLDGQGIDWDKNLLRGWVDAALWIVLLIVASLFYKRIHKVAVLVSIILVSTQLAYLVCNSVQMPEIWKRNAKYSLPISPPKEIFQFSSKQNVIHLILDSFQSDIFQEIIDEDLDYYRKALDGFTFFKETTGSFPTTYMSVPAILSGENYKNDVPMREFVERIMNGKTITNVLYDNGYVVDLVMHGHGFFRGNFSNCYSLPTPYGVTENQYEQIKSALLLDLVLFRYSPHFFKKGIYSNQLWLTQRLMRKEKKLYLTPLSHEAFFSDLIANMSISGKKPVYKYIHLNITHSPMVMKEDCSYAGKVLPRSKRNLKIQDKCALCQFIEFLRKLKALGIYDNSLIVLEADHGAGGEVKMIDTNKNMNAYYIAGMVGSALPLMVIKPPHSRGPLRISTAQTALTDTPATISSILNLDVGFPGQSVFDIDPNRDRERRYYHYKWLHERWQADFFPRLDEYFIKGSVFDRSSWQLGAVRYSKHNCFRTDKLDFGTSKGSDYLLAGWGYNENSTEEGYDFNWALGKSAVVTLSFPKERVILEANVKPYVFKKPQRQTIIIKVDGKVIGTWDLDNRWEWQKRSIIIPADEHRPNVSVLEFVFSQYLKAEGKRSLAVLFESITLSLSEGQN